MYFSGWQNRCIVQNSNTERELPAILADQCTSNREALLQRVRHTGGKHHPSRQSQHTGFRPAQHVGPISREMDPNESASEAGALAWLRRAHETPENSARSGSTVAGRPGGSGRARNDGWRRRIWRRGTDTSCSAQQRHPVRSVRCLLPVILFSRFVGQVTLKIIYYYYTVV